MYCPDPNGIDFPSRKLLHLPGKGFLVWSPKKPVSAKILSSGSFVLRHALIFPSSTFHCKEEGVNPNSFKWCMVSGSKAPFLLNCAHTSRKGETGRIRPLLSRNSVVVGVF